MAKFRGGLTFSGELSSKIVTSSDGEIKILTCLRFYLVQSQHMSTCNITFRVLSSESPDAYENITILTWLPKSRTAAPCIGNSQFETAFQSLAAHLLEVENRRTVSFIGRDVSNSAYQYSIPCFQKKLSAPKGHSTDVHLATLVAHPTFYPLDVRRQHIKANIQL
jgi:hypothetical protein